MCGIAALITYRDTVKHKKFIATALEILQNRGIDASGFATYTSDGKLIYRKMPGRGAYLARNVRMMPKRLFRNARVSIVHDRAATKGEVSNNENNHPLWALTKHGVATLAHNGIVWSKTLKPEREVDSDLLLTYIRKKREVTTNTVIGPLRHINGGYAVMVTDSPWELFFYRNTNPIHYIEVPGFGLILASERWHVMELAKVLGVGYASANEIDPYALYLAWDGGFDKIDELPGASSRRYYYDANRGWTGYEWHDYEEEYEWFRSIIVDLDEEKYDLGFVSDWASATPEIPESFKALLGSLAAVGAVANYLDEEKLAHAIKLARAAGLLHHDMDNQELCFTGIEGVDLCDNYKVIRTSNKMYISWGGMSVAVPVSNDVWDVINELDRKRKYVVFENDPKAFKEKLNELKSEIREYGITDVLGD